LLIKSIIPVLWIIITAILWIRNIQLPDESILSNQAILGISIPPIVFSIYELLKNSLSDLNKIAFGFIKNYTTRKSFGHILGLQKEIQDELRTLLQSWIWKKDINNKKIILIIDDIDRCNPDNVLDLLDSLRVVLDDDQISKRLKIIIAVDHLIVKDMMKKRFSEYFKNAINKDKEEKKEKQYIRDYFDKLFLFSLHLAPLSLPEVDQIIDSIFETSLTGVEDENKHENTDDLNTPAKTELKNDVNNLDDSNLKDQTQKEIIPEVSILKPMTNDELASFKVLIGYHGCTPRRMRILYYRYIFSKCLIDSLNGGFDADKSREILELMAKYEKDGKIGPINDNKPEILEWILFD
jgi:hypothetical protein